MFLLATLIVTLHNKVFLPYVLPPIGRCFGVVLEEDMDPTLNNPSILRLDDEAKKKDAAAAADNEDEDEDDIDGEGRRRRKKSWPEEALLGGKTSGSNASVCSRHAQRLPSLHEYRLHAARHH